MKMLKILGHPYTVVISFLLLLISGEHFGGFYILYILLALPHGGIHAVLAVLGIAVLLFNQYKRPVAIVAVLASFAGLIFLLLSLFFFFYNDSSRYNAATFEQTIPLLSLAGFGIFVLSSIVNNFMLLTQARYLR